MTHARDKRRKYRVFGLYGAVFFLLFDVPNVFLSPKIFRAFGAKLPQKNFRASRGPPMHSEQENDTFRNLGFSTY